MDLTKIERMCSLIRSNATGRPDEFARRMGMSSRTMFNYISFMKSSLNAPIEYCNKKQSYYYKEKGLIQLKWTPEE